MEVLYFLLVADLSNGPLLSEFLSTLALMTTPFMFRWEK